MVEAQIEANQEGEENTKVHCLAHIGYFIVRFFAYWFGASRFDLNGDGAFEAADVQVWLEDRGIVRNSSMVERSSTKLNRSGSNLAKSGTEPSDGHATPRAGSKPLGPEKAAPRAGSKTLGSEKATPRAGSKTLGSEKATPRSWSKTSGNGKKGDLEGHDGERNYSSADGDDELPFQGRESWRQSMASWLDRDGDGAISFNDLVHTHVDGDAQEDLAMQKLVTGQVKPWFVIIQCLGCFFLWFICAVVTGGRDFPSERAGLDSFFDTKTDLRFYGAECQDYRWHFWRWFTYQFTHVGVVHIVMNVFLNIMLGVPLEAAHGHWRLIVLFNAGVFGGACANMILDGRNSVVGCSGGCYALIGIHVADLMMNWHQKKFRLPTLIFILLMISVDVGMNVAASHEGDTVSHAAHMGGAAMGLLTGIVVGENMKMMRWEKILIAFSAILNLGVVIFCFSWLFTQSEGPQSLFEDAGWCWTQQVANETFPEPIMYCIKCGTESCVQHFKNVAVRAEIVREACEESGFWDHGL